MNRRALLFSLLLSACGSVPAHGQTLWLADGHRVELTSLPARIENGQLAVASRSGTIWVPMANILRVEWPLPPAFAAAAADLKLGHAEEALAKIDPWLDAQEPFREVPGSSWNFGVSLRAAAYVQLDRVGEADAILVSLQAGRPDPASVVRVHLAMAEQFLQRGLPTEARVHFVAIGAGTRDDANQAFMAVVQGSLLRAEGKIDEALLSYLRVPVYFPHETDQWPAALLGALRCYRASGDPVRAERTAEQLQKEFNRTPEAAIARLEAGPLSLPSNPR
jgi:hypothetical protein